MLVLKLNMSYKRKLEPFFQISSYVAEFWNTISNAPFIIIGLLRLMEGTDLETEYKLMVLAGIASAIHHATTPRWTILIDWAPIAWSCFHILRSNYLLYLSPTAIFEILLAFFILVTDHVYTYIPVPWGHVFWHIVAALSIDCAYQSIQDNFFPCQ